MAFEKKSDAPVSFLLPTKSDGVNLCVMAARLKDHSSSPPGGFKFRVPVSGWEPPPFASFDTVVRMVIDHLRVNAAVRQKLGWEVEYNSIANRVDRENAERCKSHGWLHFILEDEVPSPPKPTARSQANPVARLAAGGAVVAEMFGPDGPVQDQQLVNERALICSTCEKNDRGDWTRFFTVPAQAMVRATLRKVKDMNLRSDYDDQLRTCVACGCPLKGKVHARLAHILAHMPKEDFDQLVPKCWIRGEKAALELMK